MRSYFLTRQWADELTAVFAAIAVIFVGLFGGNCAAHAEEPSSDSVEKPAPLEYALPYLEQNPAMVGWLKVGTFVDTPVVRGSGSFYLNHDFRGEHSYGGTIFIDEDCSILPKDEHLIVYGHNMKDGSVFGDMDRYRDLTYLKANPIVTFDTIYEEQQYVIVAVYDMSAETEDPHFMQILHFNFIDNEDFWTFYHEIEKRNIYAFPVDVEYGDPLLSLVTCSYTLFDGRLILTCRELRPDEDPQEISEIMQSTTYRE